MIERMSCDIDDVCRVFPETNGAHHTKSGQAACATELIGNDRFGKFAQGSGRRRINNFLGVSTMRILKTIFVLSLLFASIPLAYAASYTVTPIPPDFRILNGDVVYRFRNNV